MYVDDINFIIHNLSCESEQAAAAAKYDDLSRFLCSAFSQLKIKMKKFLCCEDVEDKLGAHKKKVFYKIIQ